MNWNLVYMNDGNGNAIAGSLERLIDSLKQGCALRLGIFRNDEVLKKDRKGEYVIHTPADVPIKFHGGEYDDVFFHDIHNAYVRFGHVYALHNSIYCWNDAKAMGDSGNSATFLQWREFVHDTNSVSAKEDSTFRMMETMFTASTRGETYISQFFFSDRSLAIDTTNIDLLQKPYRLPLAWYVQV